MALAAISTRFVHRREVAPFSFSFFKIELRFETMDDVLGLGLLPAPLWSMIVLSSYTCTHYRMEEIMKA